MALFNACKRRDLGWMNNRGIQTSSNAFVEEDRIKNDAGSRVQTEGDVGNAQRCLNVGIFTFQRPNCFDCFDSIATRFFLAGCDWES